MTAPRFLRHEGRNYVSVAYMAERMKRAMEAGRAEGLIEALAIKASATIERIEEPAE